MFRVTTSTSPVGRCESWIQPWIQHRKHKFQVDLPSLECPLLPLVIGLKTSQDHYLRRGGCKPLKGELLGRGLCEWPSTLKPFAATSHTISSCAFSSYSALQIKRGIYSRLEVLLSVAWPAQVYQWLWRDFFLLYFLKSSPAPLLSPSLS